MAFLNEAGVTQLWGLIKNNFAKQESVQNNLDAITTLQGYFESGKAKTAKVADTANALTTPIAVELTGGVTGKVESWDGSSNLSINTTIGKVNAATTADKAIADGDGNTIKTTYATKNEVKNITDAKGVAGGYASLDSDGKVPSSQLPSYVDDILEYSSLSNFPATGESGKIYVAIDTNKTYRWGSSSYVEISASLALGETDSTAYSGAAGKALAGRVEAAEGKINTNTSNISDISTKVTTLDGLHTTTNNTLGLYKMKIANSHPTNLTAVTSNDITTLVEAISSDWINTNCTFN